MNDRQIDIFIQVAETGSFAKASENLYLSTVSVMNQINSLEREAEVKLLERNSKGCTLTKAGQSLYKDLKRIRDDIDAALERAKRADRPHKRSIRIGTTMLFSCNPLFEYLNRIHYNAEDYSIEIIPFTYDGIDLINILSELGDKMDIVVGAIGSIKINELCNFYKIEDTKKVFAVPVNHALAKKDSLTIQDLRGETVLMVGGNDSPVNVEVRKILQHYPDITIKDAPYVYDISVYNTCAQRGYILSTLEMWDNIHPGMKNLPIDLGSDFMIPVGLVTSKEPSEKVRQFISSIGLEQTFWG